jgi:hypothetical protein
MEGSIKRLEHKWYGRIREIWDRKNWIMEVNECCAADVELYPITGFKNAME